MQLVDITYRKLFALNNHARHLNKYKNKILNIICTQIKDKYTRTCVYIYKSAHISKFAAKNYSYHKNKTSLRLKLLCEHKK
jgi:hypothetical protein